MTQLSVVTEFEDTPEIAASLAEVARDNPAQFTHAAQLARDEREETAMLAGRTAELTAQGFTVGTERQHYENEIGYWAGPDRKQLTPENHKDCPGSIVVLRAQAWGNSRRIAETWYCTDPKDHGHKRFQSGQPEKSPEEASAERREVLDNNKLWRSATTVRQRWLRDALLASKTVPDEAVLFIARAIAAADHVMLNALSTMSGGTHKTGRELLGTGKPDYVPGGRRVDPLLSLLDGVSGQRAQVVTLALVLGAYEEQTADPQTWRHPSPGPQQYLAAIAGWGYPMSPIEQDVVDAATKTPAAAAATAEED